MVRIPETTSQVSGYGGGGHAYGNIEADSSGNVKEYIYLDDGQEIYVEGEFDGYGAMEVYGEDDNYYELEVDWH